MPLIADYRNVPAQHCGSGAMGNLLYHYYGLELPEAVIFGLGSGLDCIYLKGERFDPPEFFLGRSASMELDLGIALGVDYREEQLLDNKEAWEVVKREVDAGRPTMLAGDIFYLDYRDYKVHFPGHRFVLLGYDDAERVAFIADRTDGAPQRCSYAALAQSRNPSSGSSNYNLWGKFHGSRMQHSLEQACRMALQKYVDRMLGFDTSQKEAFALAFKDRTLEVEAGLQGLDCFIQQLQTWPQRKDVSFITSYNSQVIERFGNGGGNFRRMYAEFLAWASQTLPDLVPNGAVQLSLHAADTWTALFNILYQASKSPANKVLWKQAIEQSRQIYQLEYRLFSKLNDRLKT